MTDPETIAAGLTEAQKSVVTSLPLDGGFGPARTHQTARYMWYGIGKGRADGLGVRLVDHQYCTANSWCLTPLGLAVREVLERSGRR